MNYPKIFVFDNFLVKGEMGEKTNIERKIACNHCNRVDIIEHVLSYKFDEWRGEDIIKGANFYLFSEKLKIWFDKNDIEGVAFKKIINEKSENFKIRKSAYQSSLPVFFKIEFHNQLEGSEIWWEKDYICEICKDQKWEPTIQGLSSLFPEDPYEEYFPREVYKESWNGEKLFLLEDPGPPIITEDLLLEIKRITNQKITLREAKWV